MWYLTQTRNVKTIRHCFNEKDSSHTESAKLPEVTGLCLFKKPEKNETGAKIALVITPVPLSVPDKRVAASFPLIKKEGLNKDSDDLYF